MSPQHNHLPFIRDGVMMLSGTSDETAGRHRESDAATALLNPQGLEKLPPSPVNSCAGSTRLHILLAEDNPVNQFVAARQLKKQGHSVHVVPDGQAVLDAIQQDHFDFVLMDIQMPVMDGFTCVAEIRRREVETKDHLPVIGMTADTMCIDLERCLDSGMDDYISKPILAADLAAAIRRVLNRPSSGGQGRAPFAGVTTERRVVPVCDLTAALKSFDGDGPFLSKLVQLFIDTVPDRLESLKLAVTSGHPQSISDAAHSIKGSVRYFLAEPAYEAAQRLEIIGRTGVDAAIDQAYSELLHELQRLIVSLQATDLTKPERERPMSNAQ